MSDNSFEIKVVNDSVGRALDKLLAQAHNLRPALLDFAEWAKAETDQRFAEQKDWHGQPWEPNAPTTLAAYIRHGGKKNFKKDGSLSKRGQTVLANKKILQGHTNNLRQYAFSFEAGPDHLAFGPWGNGLDAYAAIQQLGGRAGRGLGVYIPARAYLPVDENGQLAPVAEAELLAILGRYFDE
ncbi:phage virion morphogenesis protein [Paludibacterium denitrificans]|uniref:Virion morphogenesis protein n=1 Tax=Paludibacterium denitrificans TaxID=2675226 RepID=A0A844GBQ9_9NEIS|nr:phage virion morphogenesis protein [Paludibacterium denitrificans]MTD33956.1 virion morphogenesis protein [Paludibacterium denitrificans]